MREALWIALATIGWGAWSVVEKLALRNSSPMMVQLTNAYIYSALAPVIYLSMKARGDQIVWTKWGIIWTCASTLIGIVANYAFLSAIQSRPVHEVTALTQTYPILSFVLCWFVLGEQFTMMKALGAVLLISGAVLVSR